MEIEYDIQVKNHNSHLIDIQMKFTAPWDNPILEMPVWTPGSYMIRDYARHLQEFSSKEGNTSGKELVWKKVSKTQWKILVASGSQVCVSYRMYAFELTVRTSYLDDKYALLSPASLFFYIVNADGETTKDWKYSLTFNMLPEWEIFTSLKQTKEDTNDALISHRFAKDFDELVDSPIGLAHKSAYESKTYAIGPGRNDEEVPCQVALIGISGNQNIDKFTDALQKLQEKSIEMFGELPYDRYVWVLYVVGNGGGGLEHKYSNFSIINRWYFENDEKNWGRLMSLESHEHFHTYNIKRIRPKQLGPFDYSQEVYTRLLWVAEGITSHYDKILLPRANIVTRKLYLETTADRIKDLYQVPGRKISSIEDASFDAWIKLYKADENHNNSSVSYYLKGGLVALLLDLEIRKQTDWEKSLDDFYLQMYNKYKENPETGFEEEKLQSLIEETTNTDLSSFFGKYVRGTELLDFNYYLNEIGLELKTEIDEDIPFIGWNLKNGSETVSSVLSDSPAMEAGIYAKDIIVAINHFKFTNGSYEKILKNFNVGDEIKVHLFRDDVLRSVTLKLGNPVPTKFKIKELENIADLQLKRLKEFFHETE